MGKRDIRPHHWVEIFFDIGYLLFGLCAGIYFLLRAEGRGQVLLYAALALVLAGGDAFHLLPRVWGLLRGGLEPYRRALGAGKLVTSVTMTVFYLLLCALFEMVYAPLPTWLWAVVLALAAVRIALCLMPQNRWLDADPPLCWGIYRNLPFLALGVVVVALYGWGAARAPAVPVAGAGLSLLWLAVVISFGFYLPVVLFSQKKPALGALMLPKTAAYIWMLAMGFSLV